ncbi:hypothetical protein NDU88_003392 [Pleurodeles waltl]|uniref:Uncharacterized protein n=1 Tax=Pleurodeles waltl TaxID=8319 RepID=A0AAV7M4E7_PLEWA|nr:hypothetical protein NDU88_003392 [Pleurodeles waltl]
MEKQGGTPRKPDPCSGCGPPWTGEVARPRPKKKAPGERSRLRASARGCRPGGTAAPVCFETQACWSGLRRPDDGERGARLRLFPPGPRLVRGACWGRAVSRGRAGDRTRSRGRYGRNLRKGGGGREGEEPRMRGALPFPP